ncbi:MAG: hypothetical protein ACLQVL_22400 [Terriglobia bacterium]
MLATLHVAEAYIVQALAWIRPEELPSHRLDYLLSWIRVWMGVYQAQFCDAPLSACSECATQ